MSKEFSFANKGTCSKQTNFVLNDDHTIASIEVIGGCNGNLKGICQLVTGMKADRNAGTALCRNAGRGVFFCVREKRRIHNMQSNE